MTTPYYHDDLVTLYLGSCLEVDEWLAADVLITDPPYGLNAELSNGTPTTRHGSRPKEARATRVNEKPTWDADLEVRDRALEQWGLNWATGECAKPYAVFASPARLDGAIPHRGFPLVWDKMCVGMGDTDFPWGRAYELIYVNGPGWHTAGGLSRSPIIRVQHFTGDAKKHGHPTPKPLPLMGELVRKAPPGVIADPFSGSGSTLRACKDEGRRAIGVEMNEAYCERAAKRLVQDTLFADLEPPRSELTEGGFDDRAAAEMSS
jgi:site-specific DNA-methyltransferase (adenine-specific)